MQVANASINPRDDLIPRVTLPRDRDRARSPHLSSPSSFRLCLLPTIMATVTHTIYSRYDPADREKLEKETGQATEVDESEDWALKSSFLRRAKPPPRFVPATVAYEDFSLAGSNSCFPRSYF